VIWSGATRYLDACSYGSFIKRQLPITPPFEIDCHNTVLNKNGTRLATTTPKGGQHQKIAIYDTHDLSKPPLASLDFPDDIYIIQPIFVDNVNLVIPKEHKARKDTTSIWNTDSGRCIDGTNFLYSQHDDTFTLQLLNSSHPTQFDSNLAPLPTPIAPSHLLGNTMTLSNWGILRSTPLDYLQPLQGIYPSLTQVVTTDRLVALPAQDPNSPDYTACIDNLRKPLTLSLADTRRLCKLACLAPMRPPAVVAPAPQLTTSPWAAANIDACVAALAHKEPIAPPPQSRGLALMGWVATTLRLK
jgi:hypothetical protein